MPSSQACKTAIWCAVLGSSACTPVIDPFIAPLPDAGIVAFTPAPLGLRRLTVEQHRRALATLVGSDVVAGGFEQQIRTAHFGTVWAARGTFSPLSIETLEAQTMTAIAAVFSDSNRRRALVGCEPQGASDPCVARHFASFASRAFRRPVDPAEVQRYQALVSALVADSVEVWEAIGDATAGILQSPGFLYVLEEGEADPTDGSRLRLTSREMATRLAFFLTGTLPDAELVAAGERGDLVDVVSVRHHASRLQADPSWSVTARQFWDELLDVPQVGALQKTSTLVTPTLLASQQRELEFLVGSLLGPDANLRDLFVATNTYVNFELAAFYGLPAPPGEGFSRVELPPGSARGGLLGTAAFLSLNAHVAHTSPARRGGFVRERLLCQTISPPPPGLDTSIPLQPVDAPPQTLRQRLEGHTKRASCAGCHSLMDPIGFGLEAFDAVGRERTMEDGLAIDARGDLDGVAFKGPRELGAALAADERTATCLTRQLYRFASGHVETEGEAPVISDLAGKFRTSKQPLRNLFLDVATSDGFRFGSLPKN